MRFLGTGCSSVSGKDTEGRFLRDDEGEAGIRWILLDYCQGILLLWNFSITNATNQCIP